jgi:hypothetical protein
VEVVDGFDVEAFGFADVFEDFPVCACWSGLLLVLIHGC